MDDLIKDVKIDGKHSTEDAIMNIIDFRKKYPEIAALGGVDINILGSSDESKIRSYVKNIMDNCMLEGKFALGSGNSIPNYIPIKNYLTMLDAALSWQT
jgi:uroporphyrinogen decarboxylase